MAIILAGVLYEVAIPDRMTGFQAYDQPRVTVASILRLVYLCHRFYGTRTDDSWTEFKVSLTR